MMTIFAYLKLALLFAPLTVALLLVSAMMADLATILAARAWRRHEARRRLSCLVSTLPLDDTRASSRQTKSTSYPNRWLQSWRNTVFRTYFHRKSRDS